MWYDQNLYGNYRNLKFNDVWSSGEQFEQDYNSFNERLLDSRISGTAVYTCWALLSARYGNSTIASANVEQFKDKVFTTIFMYGPTWEKRVEIQAAIRNLISVTKDRDGNTVYQISDELRQGGKAIYNTALNPSTPVTVGDEKANVQQGTQTTSELSHINQQNTTNYKKSTPEAYSILISLLDTDVTGGFLDRFKKLFLTVVSPELPLWYISEKDDGEVVD